MTDQPIRGRITGEVKLRDRAEIFVIKDIFGFIPERLIVIKVAGKNNWYQLMAEFTPEELEKESRKIKEILPDYKPPEETKPQKT